MNGEDTAFIVVTGSMRSGTSLVGHVLQTRRDGARAHPELAFDNDRSDFIADFFDAVRLSCEPVAAYGDPFRVVSLTKPMLERFYGVSLDDFSTALERIRSDFRAEIQRWSPPGSDSGLLGFKRTSMNYELGVLQDIFPNMKVVLTVRDPRDVFLSYWMRNSYLTPLGLHQGSGYNLMILAYILGNYYFIERLRELSASLMVITYEDFVREPRGYVQQLLDFIGLDQASYDFAGLSSTDLPTNSSFSSGRGVDFVPAVGISTDSVGRFRATIDPEVVSFVEVLCAPVFETYGYLSAPRKRVWRPAFQAFVEDMHRYCIEYNVSFAPVTRRLQELG